MFYYLDQVLTTSNNSGGGREAPGAILRRVRVPDAARDFSPRVNFQCRLSSGVRVYNGMNQHQQ